VVSVYGAALCRDQTGFTLVELLLALLLFGIISGVIFATFAAISKGVERGRDSSDFYHVGRAAMRRLVQEMEAAFVLPIQGTGPVSIYAKEPLKGEDATVNGIARDRVMFLTIPAQRFPEGMLKNELCQVCYYVAENTQGVPAFFRHENCTLNKDDKEEKDRCSGTYDPVELTDAVVGLDVTYLDQKGESQPVWPPEGVEGVLPCQVRLTLFLQQAEQPVRTLATTVSFAMRGKCEPQT
jgi:prepilin-type N-terminal cleavage/methylation domain-containing protein